ncbi:MAG: hypothetical protein AABW83_01270 [Nanoarchaeota archaeon]
MSEIIIRKIPVNNIDYVEFYAEKMSKNNSYFRQQKDLIESQIIASNSLFKSMFRKNFKKKARVYLMKIGLLKPINKINYGEKLQNEISSI